jgi:cation transport regulator ChaB
MFKQLGNKDLPHSIRKQLQDAKQNVEESIEELTERVQEMATDGYSEHFSIINLESFCTD